MTGSTALEGLLDWLVSDDELAVAFLQKYRVECIPMVCMDGVIAGTTHSAGYAYGGFKWHLEKSHKEIQNVKDFIKTLHENGDEFVLAGKLHGGMRYEGFPIDFLTSDPDIDQYMMNNTFGEWKPMDLNGGSLTIRPKGYFERHMVDEYRCLKTFGVHVNGNSVEQCYGCGRDRMINFARFFLKR